MARNIICFTSWNKRINNCVNTIRMCLNQTVPIDAILLTLSKEEFPNGSNDLPQELKQIVSENPNVYLLWVNDNLKTMKKVFPALTTSLVEDDDYILYIDDDLVIPPNLFETRLRQIQAINNEGGITSFQNYSIRNAIFSSYTSIIQAKMLKHFDKFINRGVLETFEDDWVYTAILLLNGYTFHYADEITRDELTVIQDNYAAKDLKIYNTVTTVDVLNIRIKELTNNETIYTLKDNLGKYKDSWWQQ